MCSQFKVLKTSKNGLLTYCAASKLFQLVFNNLCFELYEWELKAFKEYLFEVDINYWEEQLSNSRNPRKIPLSVGAKHFIILLNQQELLELKTLLTTKNKVRLLKPTELVYEYSEN
ncbi:hypothetical protein GCM10011414_19490 [Croceivirga lutea]|uniref:DUF6686 family protein n=1 Tax=Croceivirga lutea TaxID=1775167 RepID=UPI0016398C8D|nr:DUF6686 family protein [Croceivirga lutea]GGG49795.1 hypothetical protein GCM10011414_19490 [Croceivirga lutea]